MKYRLASIMSNTGGSDQMIIVVMVIIFCCIVSLMGGYFSMLREEGDKCKGDDENAEYIIDSEGYCNFVRCKDTTYIKDSTGICVLDQSGQDCTPEGTPDANAIYETNVSNVCEFNSCIIGYEVGENDVCIMAEIEDDGSSGGTGGGSTGGSSGGSSGGGSSGGTGGGSSGGTGGGTGGGSSGGSSGGGSSGGGSSGESSGGTGGGSSGGSSGGGSSGGGSSGESSGGTGGGSTGGGEAPDGIIPLNVPTSTTLPSSRAATHYGLVKNIISTDLQQLEVFDLEGLSIELIGRYKAGGSYKRPSQAGLSIGDRIYLEKLVDTMVFEHQGYEEVQGTVLPSPSECTVTTPITRYIDAASYTYATWNSLNENWEHFNNHGNSYGTTLKVLDSDGCNVLGHQDGYQLWTHQPNFNQNVAWIDLYAVRVKGGSD